ncbi:MAG: tetratricopeptide repeat protein [Flavobacteriales bacterium]|nr:tetratricopeptide repeat protein [Flavobacteriales bacterium]
MRGAWFFVLLAIGIHGNTVWNRFALDDGLVLNENGYVLQGIAGIPDILTHDSFHGAVGRSAYLSGGRYRPLSLVTFAIEVSLFGLDPVVHHGLNVLLFALLCLVLFRFLQRFVFPGSAWASWCTTLLFTVHPIHTEVVANIKGRDEILSLLFLLLTLHHALLHVRWLEQRPISSQPTSEGRSRRTIAERSPGRWSGLWSVLFFGLALLSKENGLLFIALLPLSIHYFTDSSFIKAIKRSLPVIVIVLLYVGMRVILLEARNNTVEEIMDNPYLHSSISERIGSILFVFLCYAKLMIWPHPLTYDYSYHQVPYHDMGDPIVYLSLALHGWLFAYAVYTFKRKDIIGWCIFFHLAGLLMVSNLVFNIGAPMAERFLFMPSVPFLIGIVEVLRRGLSGPLRSAAWRYGLAFTLFLITTASCVAVVARNAQWSTGDTLFLHDVAVSRNSARARTYAGIAYIHLADSAQSVSEKRKHAQLAVEQFLIADSIHPTYMPTLLNMGLAYLRLDSIEVAERWWDRARAIDPTDGKLKDLELYLFDHYYRGGLTAGTAGDLDEGVRQLRKAVKYAPNHADAWYNLGGVLYTAKRYAEARTAWQRTLELAPEHKDANAGMAALNTLGL